MIDIHCHLLPGVDDGPESLAVAVEMCAAMAADGCRAAIATPHLRHELWANDGRARLESLCEDLRRALADRRREPEHAREPHLEVRLGGEIAVNSESVRELERLPAGELLPLAGSRYLLLELDRHGLGPDPFALVHELTVAGYLPILAHPERISWLAADPGLLGELVEAGATLQLTAMSVTGELGEVLQRRSATLLEEGLVAFVASDAHDPRHRRPGLSRAWRFVSAHWGAAAARRMFFDNPAAVLHDRPLTAAMTPVAV